MQIAVIMALGVALAALAIVVFRRLRHADRRSITLDDENRSLLALRVREADELVSAYAKLIEGNEGSILMPESSLPASRDDIKLALVTTAAAKLRAGLISDSEVGLYRASYMLLMNFVPDDQAARASGITDAARALKHSATESNEELLSTLKAFADNRDLLTDRGSTDEGLLLVREFDLRLAELVSGL